MPQGSFYNEGRSSAMDYARAFAGSAYSHARRQTTAVAPASGAIFASFRLPATVAGAEPMIAVVCRLVMWFGATAAATAIGFVGLRGYKVTGYTAEDTGGTAVAPTKLDSRFADALLSPMLAAAGALTAGTRTQDAAPFAGDSFAISATAPANLPTLKADIIDAPMILRPGQGIELLHAFAAPTTLTGYSGFAIEWAEIPEKNYIC